LLLFSPVISCRRDRRGSSRPAGTFPYQLVIDTVSWPLTSPGPVMFADGFETGDTSRWSTVVP